MFALFIRFKKWGGIQYYGMEVHVGSMLIIFGCFAENMDALRTCILNKDQSKSI